MRDPYRTTEEVEEWRKRDPIKIHRELLTSQGIAVEEEIQELEAKVRQELEEAVEFAYQSPYPDPEDLFEDMYADAIPLE